MKTSVRVALFLVIAFICSNALGAEELTLVVGDWPPHVDRKADNQGYMTEIVIKAFKESGINASVKYFPWKRVAYNVDTNNKVSFSWIWSAERSKKWIFSDTISEGLTVFVTKKDKNIPWKTLEALTPYAVGITDGYSYGDEFDNYKDKLKIRSVTSDEQNLRKLLKGRIDIFPVNRINFYGLMRSKFTKKEKEQFKLLSPPVFSSSSHVVCAKTNDKCPYYIEKFNQGLQVLIKKGTKKQILAPILSLE